MSHHSKYLGLLNLFSSSTPARKTLRVNPTVIPQRPESTAVKVYVYEFDAENIVHHEFDHVSSCLQFRETDKIKWINVDGINKASVEALSHQFNIHYLLAEDIQSMGLRPKMDEIDNHLFCLLHMLFFNPAQSSVESEQISLVLGNNYVISFQEDADRDVFNPLREKLKVASTRLRQSKADYLLYALIDMIVDHYFVVMEHLGEKIELLEEEIIHAPNKRSLAKINQLRKELIVLKRYIPPVRELVNGLIKSDSLLINDTTNKYFKDIYDHVIQANDLVENYREMMITMQDLYINQVNLKMNEVMKVMAIVTCLLAPAAVIGGIFGMNFDGIPYVHTRYGFFVAVLAMLIIPVWMIRVFKRRGWF